MTIREIFRSFGPEYIKRYGLRMPKDQLKALKAMMDCRTDRFGQTIYTCQRCGETHTVYRSCGNRHCPNCQFQKSRAWLDRQMDRRLPGHHFMVTFTVPAHTRRFIRSHQRIGYAALFKASSDTMKTLSNDPRYLGGDVPGFMGVLHTWGRQLQYHPHVHYIVCGGALSKKEGLWRSSRVDFYLPVKAMSRMFKAKFRDEIKKAGLLSEIPPRVFDMDWNVNCQPVGSSEASLKYLAPYVFRVAISDSRIVAVENRAVTFRYKKKGSNRPRSMTLDVMEFIRRFLQHVLPTGFVKVRHYGFLHHGSSVPLEKIKGLIELSYGFTLPVPEVKKKAPANYKPICPRCGGLLEYSHSILPYMLPPPDPG